MEINSNYLQKTKKEFEEYLFTLSYSKSRVEAYLYLFPHLETIMTKRGEIIYSKETGVALIQKEQDAGYSAFRMHETRLKIRRLDDFLNGEYNYKALKDNTVANCHTNCFNNYIGYLRLQGLRESTIKHHNDNCIKIFHELYLLQIYDISEIKPQDIYDVFSKVSDKANTGKSLRCLLRYLFKSGVLADDLSVIVPSVRARSPIPSVYTKDETNRLLSSIDTSQKIGKRNYAIILLVLRLGIRSGDIVNLKLSDIDFRSDVIEFVQSKTCVKQRMEFLPELKDALQTYLSEGRPETKSTNFFISARAPFRHMTVTAVSTLITNCMKKSGISPGNRKHGGHALRMTLASELVSEKVPYEVVRKILGHEDTMSMKHYVKFDIEMLRSCALEVPPLTGLYSEYISNRMGGCKK